MTDQTATLRAARERIERTAQHYVDENKTHWYRAADVHEALATPPADPRDGPACWHCEHPEAHDD